jgi:hypothetical protein
VQGKAKAKAKESKEAIGARTQREGLQGLNDEMTSRVEVGRLGRGGRREERVDVDVKEM